MLDKAASEAQVSDAIWSNMASFSQGFGCIKGGECGTDPDVKWMRSGRGILNFVVRASFAPDRAEARVSEITRMVRSWDGPVVWRVCSDDQPDDLADLLLEHGWQNPRGADQPVIFAGMAMPLDAPIGDTPCPEGLEIRRLTAEDDLRAWPRIFFSAASDEELDHYGDVFCELALADPDNRVHYTGYLNGEPVTSGMLYMGSGVAGIYAIGTVKEARGQGIGTAITRYCLEQARDMGYSWATLQATDMGVRIYRRLGFNDYGSVRVLALRR